MVRQSLPNGIEGATPEIVVSHQARIVVGGLGTVKRTLSLVEEQLEHLESLDLVDPAEVDRLRRLAREFTDLMTHFREGRFLRSLRAVVDQTRGEHH